MGIMSRWWEVGAILKRKRTLTWLTCELSSYYIGILNEMIYIYCLQSYYFSLHMCHYQLVLASWGFWTFLCQFVYDYMGLVASAENLQLISFLFLLLNHLHYHAISVILATLRSVTIAADTSIVRPTAAIMWETSSKDWFSWAYR